MMRGKRIWAGRILIVAACVCVWVVGCRRDKAEPAAKAQCTIGIMPKLVGIDFFNAVEKGALEAGRELGIQVEYDGPTTNDVTKQAAMVETWIARKFDAICTAPNDPEAIAPVLRKARERGIKVITFDADANPTARDYFVNQKM